LPLAVLLIAASGCAKWLAKPARQVESPGGGPPVWTSAELQRLDAARSAAPPGSQAAPETPQPLPAPYGVARAAFESPLEPQPLKPFDKWSEQDAAEQALGLIGGAAVAELAAATQSPVPERRLKAAETLGRIGPAAAPAVPQLTRLLDDPEPQIRKAAIRTLGQIGPAAKDAVPALVQTLLEERSESR
jgi:hypothetical protein